jgi:hypothetical protein
MGNDNQTSIHHYRTISRDCYLGYLSGLIVGSIERHYSEGYYRQAQVFSNS